MNVCKLKRPVLLSVLLAAALFWLLGAGSVWGAEPQQPEQPEWAVCVYMCGSNLETDDWAATLDLLEMMAAAPDMPANLRLFVLTGGAREWASNDDVAELISCRDGEVFGLTRDMFITPSSDKIQLFEITHDRQMVDLTDKLYQWVKQEGLPAFDNNMGNPVTAENYFAYIVDQFNPEHMMITFWDHGLGILGGCAFDEQNVNDKGYSDSLTVVELRSIMASLYEDYGKKVDIVSFDACLMSALDIAVAMAPYADYMIASQELEPSSGWNYLWLRNLTYKIEADTDPSRMIRAIDIGECVINCYPCGFVDYVDYVDNLDNLEECWGLVTSETMSMIDLSKIPDLNAAFEKMAQAMLAFDTDYYAYHFAEFSRISNISAGAKTYKHIPDLYDFAQNLLSAYSDPSSALYGHLKDNKNGCQEQCQALCDAAAELVEYYDERGVMAYRKVGNIAASGGMSFCLPVIGSYEHFGIANTALLLYEDLDIYPSYQDFLYAWIYGNNSVRHFRGFMQLTADPETPGQYSMDIQPESTGQEVAGVTAELHYTNLETGKQYVLWESPVDLSNWQTMHFEHRFDEYWYALGGNICSMVIDVKTSGEGDSASDNVYFQIPGFIGNDPVILMGQADYTGDSSIPEVCIYAYYAADHEADRWIYLDNPGNVDYTFQPVLAGDFNDTSTWDRLPSIELKYAENYQLPLTEEPLASGEENLYNGYFVLTDLAGDRIYSEDIPFAVIKNLSQMTVMPVPPQVYTGEAITPYVSLLFMGHEVLTDGRDYIVEYGNNVEPGEGHIVITANKDGDLDDDDVIELTFVIVKEEELDLAYVNWLIDQLPDGHLPGEEFAQDNLDSPYDEYVVHSLQAESAKMAYELLTTAQRSQIPAERLAKLEAHYNAACNNIITKAEGVAEIFGAIGLMYDYNDYMPTEEQLGTFMLEFGLPSDEDEEIKGYFNAAKAAASRNNSRITTAQIYKPTFEQDTTIYRAALAIVETMLKTEDKEHSPEEVIAMLDEYIEFLLSLNQDDPNNGVDAICTQTLSLTGAPWQHGLGVVLKLEVPTGYYANTMCIYRIDPDGQELLQDVNFITEDGRQYAVFWTDILDDACYYALFAEPVKDNGDSSSDGDGGDGNTTSGRPTSGNQTGTKPGNNTSDSSVTAGNINGVFADVQNNAWYAEAIAYVYNNGMMNGTENGFEPNAATTRAMLVTMLFRLENEPAVGNVSFSDVSQGQWFSQAIAWAADNGVVKGYEDGRFGPNDSVTREQLAVILWRYAGSPTVSDDLNFADKAQISDWAKEAMQWAVSAGIINGNTDNTLAPGSTATRAEVAMMLMRYLEK